MNAFKEFGKIHRLNRTVIVTEKLDGTNACVVVGEDGSVTAQSRSRIITVENDNFGFARWVQDHAEELKQLGPGYHFGEWWGRGIQRGYGLDEKRFSLFNTLRWSADRPACCHVVPVLATWNGFAAVDQALTRLRAEGSVAAPGFDKPEGIVAFHGPSGTMFKVTLEKDEEPKGNAARGAGEVERLKHGSLDTLRNFLGDMSIKPPVGRVIGMVNDLRAELAAVKRQRDELAKAIGEVAERLRINADGKATVTQGKAVIMRKILLDALAAEQPKPAGEAS